MTGFINFKCLREQSFIKVYGGRDRFQGHEIFLVYLGGSWKFPALFRWVMKISGFIWVGHEKFRLYVGGSRKRKLKKWMGHEIFFEILGGSRIIFWNFGWVLKFILKFWVGHENFSDFWKYIPAPVDYNLCPLPKNEDLLIKNFSHRVWLAKEGHPDKRAKTEDYPVAFGEICKIYSNPISKCSEDKVFIVSHFLPILIYFNFWLRAQFKFKPTVNLRNYFEVKKYYHFQRSRTPELRF